MIVKIMNSTTNSGNLIINPKKSFTLIETQKVEFERDEMWNVVTVKCTMHYPTNENLSGCYITTNDMVASGDIFVMNNEGKTIETLPYHHFDEPFNGKPPKWWKPEE